MPPPPHPLRNLTADQIREAALNLPLEECEKIVDTPLASIRRDSEIETALLSTIDRRFEELRTGKVIGIPAEDVIKNLEEIEVAWEEEEERRFRAYLAGEMDTFPAKQVIAEARARLARLRANQQEETDERSA